MENFTKVHTFGKQKHVPSFKFFQRENTQNCG